MWWWFLTSANSGSIPEMLWSGNFTEELQQRGRGSVPGRPRKVSAAQTKVFDLLPLSSPCPLELETRYLNLQVSVPLPTLWVDYFSKFVLFGGYTLLNNHLTRLWYRKKTQTPGLVFNRQVFTEWQSITIIGLLLPLTYISEFWIPPTSLFMSRYQICLVLNTNQARPEWLTLV